MKHIVILVRFVTIYKVDSQTVINPITPRNLIYNVIIGKRLLPFTLLQWPYRNSDGALKKMRAEGKTWLFKNCLSHDQVSRHSLRTIMRRVFLKR